MPERVLLLSYAFPPMAAPEATLSARAARELSLSGVEVDVVGAWPGRWQRSDHSLDAYVECSTGAVARVRQPFWVPAVQPTRSTRRYPDAMRFTNRRLLALLADRDIASYDAVLTWSQWHSIHLVGLALKRRHPSLRWVAHFSDLWTSNPLRRLTGVAGWLARSMERRVFAAADAMSYTTPEARHLAVGHDPALAGKAVVIPHSFDSTLYPPMRSVGEGPITVRYIGSFYAGRSPDSLFAGLAELHHRDRHGLRDVRVEIIGRVDRGMLASSLARVLPPGLVSVRPPVDYTTSLALMRDSDVLLSVDAVAEQNVFLATKLVDYLGARRPIVAITPAGMARDLVSRVGGWVGDPTSPAEVADALQAAIACCRNDRRGQWGIGDEVDAFALEHVAVRRRAFVLGERSAG
jgi:hypothetical protein